MTDSAYAALIIANLFQTAATRPAIAAALQRLTGVAPRMLEPWNIFDTGTWGHTSYWNIDTADNPARWGSPGLRYQGFIETVPAAIPAIGPNVPVYGWGAGPLGPYWNVPGYFFGIISLLPGQAITDVVNRLKAEGTTVWVKLISPAALGVVAPGSPSSVNLSNPTFSTVGVSWSVPASGTQPFSYIAQYRVTGTPTFVNTPSVTGTSTVLSGLVPVTSYDIRVVAQNAAGASTSAGFSQITTLKQPPSEAINLVALQVQATSITVIWDPPLVGTQPFSYVVQYRVSGTVPFANLAVSPGATGVSIINLLPLTTYDIDVVTSN
jgi:hypothetical protein